MEIGEAGQPIPAEEIKKHYTAQLEVDVAVMRAQRMVAAILLPARAAFEKLCADYGVDPTEWEFDLKMGTMVPKVGKEAGDGTV